MYKIFIKIGYLDFSSFSGGGLGRVFFVFEELWEKEGEECYGILGFRVFF